MVDKIDVAKLAELSRIEITEAEQSKYEKEIGSIMSFVDRIQKIGDSGASSADRTVGSVKNVFRDDINPHESGVYTEKLMNEAHDKADGYVKVKKIL